MNETKTPFYKKKWFLIGFPIFMILGLISQMNKENEKEELLLEEQKRYEEYVNSDRYKDSVANWENYINSDRYKDSIEVVNKTKNFKEYVSISEIDWKKGGFGTVAIIERISFKNESLTDVKNIEVIFKFKAETGEVIKSVPKEFKIIVKQGETRTLKDVNMGFIDKQATAVSSIISKVEKY